MLKGTETHHADGHKKCPRDRSWAQLVIDLRAACLDTGNANQMYTVRFLIREMASRQGISSAAMATQVREGTA